MIRQQRATDRGALCALALRLSQFWDFVDRRQIDAQLVSVAILCGSFKILLWSFDFAQNGNRPGIEIAAIIGAIATPWAILQSAAIGFIFQARSRSFEVSPNTASTLTATTKTTITEGEKQS